MGAYLSTPIRDKLSEDKLSDNLRYGASSMQGWRTSQEDAHTCILEYDNCTKASLFAVYDGHGGAEVAQYTAQHLPGHLAADEAYKSGKFSQALENTFISFDNTLVTELVLKELKEIAGTEPDDENVEEQEKETAMLFEEADMPLEQLLQRYSSAPPQNAAAKALKKKESLLSPVIKAKENVASNIKEQTDQNNAESIPTMDEIKVNLSKKISNGDVAKNSLVESSVSEQKCESSTNEIVEVDSTEQSNAKGKIVSKTDNDDGAVSSSACTASKIDSPESKNSLESAGPCSSSSDKEITKESKLTSSKDDAEPGSSTGRTRKPRKNVIPGEDEDETSASSSDDEEDEWGSSDEEDIVEPDSEDDDEDGEDGEDDEEVMCGGEEPGMDSGCTAVVAMLRDNELYVANAGDSRCVLCRDGKALDMSVDHKPEDAIEKDRIEKAGGRITMDGRVNGGLNLSRAIGDHSYKQNKELPDREQMISALPDVRTMTLTDKDQFMVLACDGIWNVMSSQDVVNFVRDRINSHEKLSSICEEMFEFCLAPDTTGDGTGCDNMTCIVIVFNKSLQDKIDTSAGQKRSPSEGEQLPEPDNKRQKSDG